MSFGVVLLEPEQPGNTGAIGRTCICAGVKLHLIRPLGFDTDEKAVKRAGLDYWPRLGVQEYGSYEDFLCRHPNARIWYVTTKAHKTIADADYRDGDFLMFGRESAGIPEEILTQHESFCIRIPMVAGERSLNLSNAAAITVYEALRHIDYQGLEKHGELHRLHW
ncbi:MAG: tRNA (cytidine(34)-2'-O)-methyltransferase [Oscillospiraceae bacterium]|nr:tRNA (cytidine(34)-2'-O)-methyltransferase [Oscillospiraceae bacterium]